MPRSPDAPSSRDEILALLRAGPHTAGELAEAIDISPQAVRDQLRTLEGRGWVEVGSLRRDTGGKPAREYALTADGEEAFDKPYPELLRHLLAELADRLGRRRKRELFEAVGRRIAADLGRRRHAGLGPSGRSGPGDLRERLEAAVEVLDALGGAAAVEGTDDGWRIRSHGCPVSGLVREDPDACRLAGALVEAISGVAVTETCERDGRPRCRFDVAGGPVPDGDR